MKFLIFTLIIIALPVMAQPDCTNFTASLKKVKNNYSEFSKTAFPDYISINLDKVETVFITLNDKEGKQVSEIFYNNLEPGSYIIRFYNPLCPGVYFISIKTESKQENIIKLIRISDSELPTDDPPLNQDISESEIDGTWMRSYVSKFIPQLQPGSGTHKIEYHYKYDIKLNLSKGSFKIILDKTDEDNKGKQTSIYQGKLVIRGDTLQLIEDSGNQSTFKYVISGDTLTISPPHTKNEKTGEIIITHKMNSYKEEINLEGIYLR